MPIRFPGGRRFSLVRLARGGADGYVNKVLTKRSLNVAKTDKTPYEWLSAETVKWSAFLSNLKEIGINGSAQNGGLSEGKMELLISNEAVELEKRRNDLQTTTYLEKLAQQIAALHFGWGLNTLGDKRRIFTANGGQTARICRAFGLDRLLHSAENFKKKETIYDQREHVENGTKQYYLVTRLTVITKLYPIKIPRFGPGDILGNGKSVRNPNFCRWLWRCRK